MHPRIIRRHYVHLFHVLVREHNNYHIYLLCMYMWFKCETIFPIDYWLACITAVCNKCASFSFIFLLWLVPYLDFISSSNICLLYTCTKLSIWWMMFAKSDPPATTCLPCIGFACSTPQELFQERRRGCWGRGNGIWLCLIRQPSFSPSNGQPSSSERNRNADKA